MSAAVVHRPPACSALDPSPERSPKDGDGRVIPVVLDTNILLDLFLFVDPQVAALRSDLDEAHPAFVATPVMREELRRVLDYPQLRPRMAFHGITPQQVMAAFDARATLCEAAPKAAFTCKDADDQKFIDLAAAKRARLISKDKAVLCMARRMASLGVQVSRVYRPEPGA